VEMVLLLPLFLLILVGLVEFGHLWYVRNTINNAAREGARAAVVYRADGATRATWAHNTATAAINNYLTPGGNKKLPTVTWSAATTPANGSAKTGDSFTVTVTASNVAMVIGKLIPAFEDMSFTVGTTMRME
jgi:Flp pilus assembly protein TadG